MSEARQRPNLRKALTDPVVVAAILGLAGGLSGSALSTRRNHDFQREEKRCERAFAFLQDEAVNSRLVQDDRFYQLQRDIAGRCSLEGK